MSLFLIIIINLLVHDLVCKFFVRFAVVLFHENLQNVLKLLCVMRYNCQISCSRPTHNH